MEVFKLSLRKLKLIGVIIAFVLCFPIHFLYDKLPCFITSIIAPVNESIWEHMKILFTSILFAGVIQKIIVKVKHFPYKNVCISNIVAALSSVFIYLILYIPIYNSIGENLPITIFLMFIVIIISQIITIFVIKFKKNLHMENWAILFTILIYAAFGLLTYYPPQNELFRDPITNIYGIKK